MRQVSEFLDRWLTRLRWPIALLVALMLPGVAWALLRLAQEIAGDPWSMSYFFAGCLGWLIVWWLFLRRTRFGLFLTLEHEFTHALFAWMTFHRVTDLRATLTRGGQMSFIGRGNFLITLAPYFFPTPSLLLLICLAVLPQTYRVLPEILIGASFGWHLTSTLRETHGRQTDIQQAGKLFSLLFLPPTILFFLGVVLSFAHRGLNGLMAFATNTLALTVEVYRLPFQ